MQVEILSADKGMLSLCRVCLEEDGNNDKKPVELFKAFFRGITIGSLLNELFRIEISEDDNLPQRICERCSVELQAVFIFREKLLKSNVTLHAVCDIEAGSNEEEHLQEETVVSCSATNSNSELVDHEYTTIEIISSGCFVCGNAFNNSEQTYLLHHDEPGEELARSDNIANKKICIVCYERLGSEEGNGSGGETVGVPGPSYPHTETLPQEAVVATQYEELRTQRYCCVTHCKEMFCLESELLQHAQDAHSMKIRLNRERQESYKSYKCNVCSRAFNSSKNLRIHQFVRTNQHKRQYACQECSFRAASATLLTIHERSHTGERPFSCNLCQKRFYSELNLKSHQICHQLERPFACSYCSKQFARKRNMEEHVRSCHSNEKPYHCDICSAKFKGQQHLRLHRRLHTGEKPYKCSYCSNSFYHISDRKRHEMTHTGEKPYSCKTCGLSYTRKRTLTIHERTHSGERPFGCNDCGKTFNQASLLKRHMARHQHQQWSEGLSNDMAYSTDFTVKNERQ